MNKPLPFTKEAFIEMTKRIKSKRNKPNFLDQNLDLPNYSDLIGKMNGLVVVDEYKEVAQ